MKRCFLRCKIHRATVTEADIDYEGSITIDQSLMELALLEPFEQVDVYNVTTGTRFTTYAIPGKPNEGQICINGAAAHLAKPGDLVIIASYFYLENSEVSTHTPTLVFVDSKNRFVKRSS